MSPRHLYLHFVTLYLNTLCGHIPPFTLFNYLAQARQAVHNYWPTDLDGVAYDPEAMACEMAAFLTGYQGRPQWLPPS